MKEKGYAKVNTTWSGGAKNVQHSKWLKKNVNSTPEEVMRKLDEVLLKLTEVQFLFKGKDVPFDIIGKNCPIIDLDVKGTLDDVKKVVDDALDDDVDNISGKKV